MPKIATSSTKGLLIKYLIKITVTTVLSVFLLSSIFSYAVLKLDLDLNMCSYASIAVCVISSILIAAISTTGFKNNILMLSLISVTPLMLYSIINFCINKTGSFAIEAIKLLLILIISVVIAVIKSTKKSR